MIFLNGVESIQDEYLAIVWTWVEDLFKLKDFISLVILRRDGLFQGFFFRPRDQTLHVDETMSSICSS